MSQSCADARPHLRRGSSWEIGSLGFALLKPEQVPLGLSIAIEPAAGHLKRVDLMHTVEGHVRFHGDIIVNPQNPNISDVDAVFGRRMARSARPQFDNPCTADMQLHDPVRRGRKNIKP